MRHAIHQHLRRIGCIEKATLTLTQQVIEVKNSLTALRRALPAYGPASQHRGERLTACSPAEWLIAIDAEAEERVGFIVIYPPEMPSSRSEPNATAAPPAPAGDMSGLHPMWQLSGLTQFRARDRSKGATGAVFSAQVVNVAGAQAHL